MPLLSLRARERRRRLADGAADYLAIVAASDPRVRPLSHPTPRGHFLVALDDDLLLADGSSGAIEAVAIYRIRVGRAIGSAALVADGEHARVDGFTSLAVLLGALGVLFGFPQADPIVGLLITVAILVIVRDAARTMWHRLMDAVDPQFVADIEHAASAVDGVQEVAAPHVR